MNCPHVKLLLIIPNALRLIIIPKIIVVTTTSITMRLTHQAVLIGVNRCYRKFRIEQVLCHNDRNYGFKIFFFHISVHLSLLLNNYVALCTHFTHAVLIQIYFRVFKAGLLRY